MTRKRVHLLSISRAVVQNFNNFLNKRERERERERERTRE